MPLPSKFFLNAMSEYFDKNFSLMYLFGFVKQIFLTSSYHVGLIRKNCNILYLKIVCDKKLQLQGVILEFFSS